jgi:hypothetical protein
MKTLKLALICVVCFSLFWGCYHQQDEKYRLIIKDDEVVMTDERGEEKILMLFNKERLSMFGFRDRERGFEIVFVLNNDAIRSFLISDEVSGYHNVTNFAVFEDTLFDRQELISKDSVFVEEKIYKDGRVEIKAERIE